MDRDRGFIRFEGVSYRYPGAREPALDGVSFSLARGEIVAIAGSNGDGKTTLCKCFNGIIPHSEHGRMEGRVYISGLDTRTAYIPEISLRVGMVLEDPDTQLFTTTVLNEVAFGPENLCRDPEAILADARWALSAVGLAGYEKRSPVSLSGGEKQRLAIASVLAMRPEILVLDEPTSQLDCLGTEEVFGVIRELRDRHGITVVLSSHKIEEIVRFADRVMVLNRGNIAAFDTPLRLIGDGTLAAETGPGLPASAALYTLLKEKELPVRPFSTIEEAEREIRKCLAGRGARSDD